MDFNEYQKLAARTMNPKLTLKESQKHSLYLIGSEVGEFYGVYQKEYQGHGFEIDHACSELGDLLWAIAEWCTTHNVSMEDIVAHNIEKLKNRYPQGFEADRSLHRAEGDI